MIIEIERKGREEKERVRGEREKGERGERESERGERGEREEREKGGIRAALGSCVFILIFRWISLLHQELSVRRCSTG